MKDTLEKNVARIDNGEVEEFETEKLVLRHRKPEVHTPEEFGDFEEGLDYFLDQGEF